jgi:hypothetical protein
MGRYIAGVLVVFAALGFAPIAQADTDNGPFSGPKGDHDASALWVDISSVADGTASQSEVLATTVCGKLEDGASDGQLIAAGAKGDESAIPKAKLIIHAIEWHFCPSYY